MAKQSKKAIDLRIERVYGQACSGIPVDIMRIPAIFEHARAEIAKGIDDEALGASLRAFIGAA